MKTTGVGPAPGRSTTATEGEAVTTAPVWKRHLTRSPATLAAVICVSAGLKKSRRGPPANVGQSPARAAVVSRAVSRAASAWHAISAAPYHAPNGAVDKKTAGFR